MEYKIIDRSRWKREEYFALYFSAVPCTYSMTTKLDITNLRAQRRKLYPTLLYLLTRTVNRYEQFRMDFNETGQLICYSSMEPSYTVFHRESETFSNLWTKYTDDYTDFCRRYEEDLLQYGNVEGFQAKPNPPQNSFPVSMIPWTGFEGFNLNLSDFSYLLPIFTIGKFYEENGKTCLPLAMQVHHAVCDGFHASRFLNDLQSQITAF